MIRFNGAQTEWFQISTWVLAVTRRDRMLTLLIQHPQGPIDGWTVAGLETPTTRMKQARSRMQNAKTRAVRQAAESDGVRAALDEHAHVVLGTRASLPAAKKLAERYARRWQRSVGSLTDCECEEIARPLKHAALARAARARTLGRMP